MRGTNTSFGTRFMGIGLAFLLALAAPLPAQANSAQAQWSGGAATGAIVTDDTCPLVVEQERLVLDIPEFPRQYYGTREAYLSYGGKVTAEYTFYNPADYTVEAVLVFPFGTVPDYGFAWDPETDEAVLGADTEKYDITVDGEVVEKTLRHTLSLPGSQFEWERDMALLYETYLVDDFYYPEMPVTRYVYEPRQVDTETFGAATAAFVLSADPSRTKVLVENQSGGQLLDEGMQFSCWVEDDPIVVNVIGEPLGHLPDWQIYENGACETEIEGAMELVRTETITLEEFALLEYEEASGVLEQDWYNAVVEAMKCLEGEYGAVAGSELSGDLTRYLMRWYEYRITLEPGQRMVNTVTAPLYPSIDLLYEPPVYQYTYLLSPAQSWDRFGTLDVEIRTPYYLTESGPDGFASTDGGYTCHWTGLPEGELTFTLCSEPEPAMPDRSTSAWPVWMGAWVLALAAVVVICLVRRTRQQR